MEIRNILTNLLVHENLIHLELCFKSYKSYEVLHVFDSIAILKSYKASKVFTRLIYSEDNFSIHFINTSPVPKFLITCADSVDMKKHLINFHTQSVDLYTLITRSQEYESHLQSVLGITYNYNSVRYVNCCTAFKEVVLLCSVVCEVLNIDYRQSILSVGFLKYDLGFEDVKELVDFKQLDDNILYSIRELVQGVMFVSVVVLTHFKYACRCLVESDSNLRKVCFEDARIKLISRRHIPVRYY